MKRLAITLATVVAVALTACTGGGAAGGIATLDAGATAACNGLQQVMAGRASMSPAQLRQSLGTVYAQAKSSSNAIIQARAVALYADATVIASGGEPGSLDADLNSMQKACTGGAAS